MRKIPYIEDFDTWKEEFKFYTEIKVRFSETDMFGHVNNVSPFIYFEQARIEFMQAKGVFNLGDDFEAVPIVADLQCDFIEQMYFGDILKVYVKANSVGNSSIDLHYLGVNQDDKVCFVGRGALVNVNIKTGKPVRIPDNVREMLLS